MKFFLYVLNGRPKRMTGRPLKAIFYLNWPLISKTLLTNTTNTDFGREIYMNFTSNIYLLECFYFIYNKTGRWDSLKGVYRRLIDETAQYG